MNERDYNFIQYFSILTALIIVITWSVFSFIYNIEFNIFTILIFLLLLNVSFWISFIAFFKKNIMILEFKSELERYRE
jgi:hypothetical protein